MIGLALLTLLASAHAVPLAQHSTYRLNPFFVYHHNPYAHTALNQLVQYPLQPVLGKSLHSINSPNELYFYQNPVPSPQHLVISTHSEQAPVVNSRFTAPPEGLVQAIYAWFAENNLPIPGENSSKNEIQQDPEKSAEVTEESMKPATAGEADVLAEADKNPNFNYPKKFGTPAIKPGQRFYILNGQPQFFGNYQPIYPQQPQVVQTRNVYPDQSVYVLQSQPDIQTSFKTKPINVTPIKNVRVKSTDEVSEKLEMKQEVTPVRYHGQALKPNVLYLRSGQQNQESAQQAVKNQFLQGLLPQSGDYQSNRQYEAVRSEQIQYPIHTQYVPVEVVPPQEKIQQVPFQLGQIAQVPVQVQNVPQPQVTYFQIPVQKDVQVPNYIKQVVPLQINARPKMPEQDEPDAYAYQEDAQSRLNPNDQQPDIEPDEDDENFATVELKKYLAGKQNQYNDAVVIDANENEDKEDTESEDITASDEPKEPSIAQAQPGGIALAGPGGVASTAPRATALVGPKGLAVASPQATAVSGPKPNDKKNKST